MSVPASQTPTPLPQQERKRSALDFGTLLQQRVFVKLAGGREVEGVLRGHDSNLNLVLDNCVEYLRDLNDLSMTTNKTRNLGLLVVKGTCVMCVNATQGMEQINNPFIVE